MLHDLLALTFIGEEFWDACKPGEDWTLPIYAACQINYLYAEIEREAEEKRQAKIWRAVVLKRKAINA